MILLHVPTCIYSGVFLNVRVLCQIPHCIHNVMYTAGYFPGSEGLIAPGMYCSYVVRFTPDSLANYEEQLMVCILTSTYMLAYNYRPLPHC